LNLKDELNLYSSCRQSCIRKIWR